MGLVASVFTGLAAILHAYIFCMESLWWSRPDVWRRFKVVDQAAADTTRPMAYNQGFYNLFLGIGTALGVVLWWSGSATVARRWPSSARRAWCSRRRSCSPAAASMRGRP